MERARSRLYLRVHAPGAAMAVELILIVENNDKSRKLVRDVLTFKRYEVIDVLAEYVK